MVCAADAESTTNWCGGRGGCRDILCGANDSECDGDRRSRTCCLVARRTRTTSDPRIVSAVWKQPRHVQCRANVVECRYGDANRNNYSGGDFQYYRRGCRHRLCGRRHCHYHWGWWVWCLRARVFDHIRLSCRHLGGQRWWWVSCQ